MNCMIVCDDVLEVAVEDVERREEQRERHRERHQDREAQQPGGDGRPGEVPTGEQAAEASSTSTCGIVWYAATSIEATGKTSRGIRHLLHQAPCSARSTACHRTRSRRSSARRRCR